MAQTQRRMLYAKIWTSEQFGYLSDKAKLLFIGMITLADDDGRLRGNPAYLRGQVFPYDENITVSEIKNARNEIEKSNLISVYEVDNCEYIQHPNWENHQIIRRDLYKESSLPSCNGNVTKPKRKSTLSKVKLSKDKISKVNTTEQSSGDDISEVIFSFKDVNPSYKKYFGNTTQRKAVERMLETHGKEELLNIIAYLEKSNKVKYAPTITTPVQLEDNLGKLIAWSQKLKEGKKTIIGL